MTFPYTFSIPTELVANKGQKTWSFLPSALKNGKIPLASKWPLLNSISAGHAKWPTIQKNNNNNKWRHHNHHNNNNKASTITSAMLACGLVLLLISDRLPSNMIWDVWRKFWFFRERGIADLWSEGYFWENWKRRHFIGKKTWKVLSLQTWERHPLLILHQAQVFLNFYSLLHYLMGLGPNTKKWRTHFRPFHNSQTHNWPRIIGHVRQFTIGMIDIAHNCP